MPSAFYSKTDTAAFQNVCDQMAKLEERCFVYYFIIPPILLDPWGANCKENQFLSFSSESADDSE